MKATNGEIPVRGPSSTHNEDRPIQAMKGLCEARVSSGFVPHNEDRPIQAMKAPVRNKHPT